MTYEIKVVRKTNKGKLSFEHGAVKVDTACWWDPAVKIDAGTYAGYATRMASKNDGRNGKKREAIWLGTDVPVNNNTRKSDEIFIHKGLNASWSDGCIVCHENEVLKIWDAVNPKEQNNITVKIEDE